MKRNIKAKQRKPQMFPSGKVQAIANAAKCTPAYVSQIIHNPEKFSGPTADLVKRLAKNLKDELESIVITH